MAIKLRRAPEERRFVGITARWLARRLAYGLVTMMMVATLVFLATQALPGDPASAILGQRATPERLAELRAQLGLNDPLPVQYVQWLGGAVSGDFGTSLSTRSPVTALIAPRAFNSFVLVGVVSLVALPFSVALGVITGRRRDTLLDRSVLSTSLGLAALPEFVIGMLLIIALSTNILTLLPAVALFPVHDSPLQHRDALILPVLTLVLAVVPYLYRLMRTAVIDTMESEFVQAARLKGITERRLLFWHVIPNAVVPSIQASALVMAWLFSGIVVVEYLFAYPGLGQALAQAVALRDVPVIQAIVLLFSAVYVVLNIIADIVTLQLSPRSRAS